MTNPVFVVGRRYMVPTVKGHIYRRLRHWPVIGPMHEDAEIINFPRSHFHIDWRFVPESDFRYALRFGKTFRVLSLVMTFGPETNNPDGVEPVTVRSRKCYRADIEFPVVFFTQPLELKYASSALKEGLICPHRGLPLTGMKPDADGNVVCPGHGLRWNVCTGKLVRRTLGAAP